MRLSRISTAALLWAIAAGQAHAQVPPTADPGRLEERFRPPPEAQSQTPIEIPAPDVQPAPAAASETHFVLGGVVIEGATVFSAAEFEPFYAEMLGQDVSLADIYVLRDAVTSLYRSEGYVLSQAIVPAQQISNGLVRIQVIEGYIDSITIEGDVRDPRGLIARTANRISQSHPLRMRDLERYALLIDDMPGVELRTVLRPSETAAGAAHLSLILEQDKAEFTLGVDNRGSEAIGPEQASASLDLNSILGLQGHTGLFYSTASDADELQYFSLSHDALLNTEGLRLSLNGGRSRSESGGAIATLTPLGESEFVHAGLSLPVIRSRARTLRLGLGFSYLNSKTDLLGLPFSEDRVRYVSANLGYDFSDTLFGHDRPAATLLQVDISHGLDVLDATESGSPDLSRANGRSDFSKLSFDLVRQQSLAPLWSVALAARGQVSADPLLSSQQFGVGGARFGRGYEPSELTGDHGLGASVEFRFDPPASFVERSQFYVFYDAGAVWMRDPLLGEPARQTLTSAGAGIRFGIGEHIDAAIELAKPLTRDVASRGDRDVRPLFSITTHF